MTIFIGLLDKKKKYRLYIKKFIFGLFLGLKNKCTFLKSIFWAFFDDFSKIFFFLKCGIFSVLQHGCHRVERCGHCAPFGAVMMGLCDQTGYLGHPKYHFMASISYNLLEGTQSNVLKHISAKLSVQGIQGEPYKVTQTGENFWKNQKIAIFGQKLMKIWSFTIL